MTFNQVFKERYIHFFSSLKFGNIDCYFYIKLESFKLWNTFNLILEMIDFFLIWWSLITVISIQSTIEKIIFLHIPDCRHFRNRISLQFKNNEKILDWLIEVSTPWKYGIVNNNKFSFRRADIYIHMTALHISGEK